MDCSTPGSLSITNSWSLLKLRSIESVMPSNHLILCRPLLLLPSMFPKWQGSVQNEYTGLLVPKLLSISGEQAHSVKPVPTLLSVGSGATVGSPGHAAGSASRVLQQSKKAISKTRQTKIKADQVPLFEGRHRQDQLQLCVLTSASWEDHFCQIEILGTSLVGPVVETLNFQCRGCGFNP